MKLCRFFSLSALIVRNRTSAPFSILLWNTVRNSLPPSVGLSKYWLKWWKKFKLLSNQYMNYWIKIRREKTFTFARASFFVFSWSSTRSFSFMYGPAFSSDFAIKTLYRFRQSLNKIVLLASAVAYFNERISIVIGT